MMVNPSVDGYTVLKP